MMKWHAVKEKSGAYEIRRTGGEVFGGIIIDGKNRGIGFVGSARNNQYIFEYEEGVFNKTVKIYGGNKNNRIGTRSRGIFAFNVSTPLSNYCPNVKPRCALPVLRFAAWSY